jgi:hypothetical protein
MEEIRLAEELPAARSLTKERSILMMSAGSRRR